MSQLFVCNADGCKFKTESMDAYFRHIDWHKSQKELKNNGVISYDCTICKLFLNNGCKGKEKSCDKWCR